jgi:hypothetical protein
MINVHLPTPYRLADKVIQMLGTAMTATILTDHYSVKEFKAVLMA